MPPFAAGAGQLNQRDELAGLLHQSGWGLGKMAKGISQDVLRRAEDLFGRGTPRQQVFNETRWLQEPSGTPLFEAPAHLQLPKQKEWTGKLHELDTNILDYYPQMRDIEMRLSDNPLIKEGGWHVDKNLITSSNPDPLRRRGLAAHELQHAIDQIERRSSGTSLPEGMNPRVMSLINEDLGTKYKTNKWGDVPRPLIGQFATSDEWSKFLRDKQFEVYQRNMGEVSARNADRRLDYGANRIAEEPWWATLDKKPEEMWSSGPGKDFDPTRRP